jgi:hypothetical protein
MIDYLREENRVLREQLDEQRLLLNDGQHRRLAAKAILMLAVLQKCGRANPEAGENHHSAAAPPRQ